MRHFLHKHSFFATGIFLSLALFLSFSNEDPYEVDCAKFRKGSFMMRSEAQPGIIFYMDRNDSIQIERVEGTDIIVKTKVEWLGPCEYRLSFLSANEAGMEALKGVDHKPVTMKIVKTTKNYYIYEARVDGVNNVILSDTLVKLK